LEADLEIATLGGPSANSSHEWDAVRVYAFAADRTGSPSLEALDNPDLIRSLFTSAKSTTASQSIDSRNVNTQNVLWWDGLLNITGSEDVLRQAAETLRAVDGTTPLLELVDQYLSGWRPKSWGERVSG
jgi:hypothetical protein